MNTKLCIVLRGGMRAKLRQPCSKCACPSNMASQHSPDDLLRQGVPSITDVCMICAKGSAIFYAIVMWTGTYTHEHLRYWIQGLIYWASLSGTKIKSNMYFWSVFI